MALEVAGFMSRGSKTSVAKIIGVGLLTRSESAIIAAPDAHSAHFGFGDDQIECARLSFGDLETA
ncbi:MAG: hypothetical protein ACOH2K_11775 [Burkholderiaceae bacterium]